MIVSEDKFLPLLPADPTEVAGYILRARLGSGGMGTVYLSFSRGGRPVAIKLVRQDFADDPEFRYRFAREIAAAQQVQGHYTAAVVDAAPGAQVPWFATAYIAGPSLQKAVTDYGPFPLFTVFRLLAGAAEGVAAVHAAGIVHRDLKPANVLLAQDGPRVIDFGIAYAANAASLTSQRGFLGTPGYMAPEQFHGQVSPATDVYGLGQLALYAATGHPAFSDGPAETLFYRIANEPPNLDGCPEELWPLLVQCLDKNPANRPRVTDVMDYARDAMRGDTMRVMNEGWLPPSVTAALADYAPGTALAVNPSRPLPVATNAPSALPVTGATSARRPWRPWRPWLAAAISLIVMLGAGCYIGYRIGESDKNTASPATGPAVSGPLSPTASKSGSPTASGSSSPTGSGSALGSQPTKMRMLSDGCKNKWPIEVKITQTAITPTRNAPSPGGDLYIDCSGSASIDQPQAATLGFDGNRVAFDVPGNPDAHACSQQVAVAVQPSAATPLSSLRAGENICMVETLSTAAVILLNVQEINKADGDITFLVTVWPAQ